MSPEAGRAFIRANTALATPSMVPEIRLHLASEITPIWRATEASLQQQGVDPPYWAFAWPGGQALARYILDHAGRFAGATVADFASGSGLAAIAAARAGAALVIAGDIDPLACQAIALNAAANDVALSIDDADWLGSSVANKWAEAEARALPHYVLAGDVCYEKPMAERALAWLRGQARSGAIVLLGDPGRHYLPRQGLREVARYDIPTSLQLENRGMKETVLWQVAA